MKKHKPLLLLIMYSKRYEKHLLNAEIKNILDINNSKPIVGSEVFSEILKENIKNMEIGCGRVSRVVSHSEGSG